VLENPSLSSEIAPWVITADERRGFGARAREVWRYRQILWFFTVRSMQALAHKTHLGGWWLFIRTLVPLAVGAFIFGEVMNVESGAVPYFVFFLAGQIPWNCFDGPLIRASRGLDVNRQLLTKLYVPRIILPMGQIGAGLIEPIIITALLIVSLVYYRTVDGVWYVQGGLRSLAAIPSVLLIVLFAFSLSLFTSVWQARARDAKFALRMVVGFWMYFTPVVYPLSKVPSNVRWLVYLNPLTAPVETFKWALLPGFDHTWRWFAYSVVATTVLFLTGAWYFAWSESATVDKL